MNNIKKEIIEEIKKLDLPDLIELIGSDKIINYLEQEYIFKDSPFQNLKDLLKFIKNK